MNVDDRVTRLRRDAEALFRKGLEAADPAEAVRERARRWIEEMGEAAFPPELAEKRLGAGREAPARRARFLRIVAAGKASLRMLGAALEVIPREALAGPPIAVIHDAAAEGAAIEGSIPIVAGHPVPDSRGEEAAARVESFVSGSRPGDVLLLLLSGGASALLPAPAPGLSLADKVETTRLLLPSGASIEELNAVRKHLSRL